MSLPRQRRSICFYDDNPEFGGHQVMACYGIEAFAADRTNFAPIAFYNPDNSRLRSRLQAVAERTGNLKIRPTPLRTGHLQTARNLLNRKEIAEFAEILTELNPARFITIQENIADSCQGMIAARLAGIEIFSYIPVPHTLALMGVKLGGVRDLLHSHFSRLPHAFVTISPAMEELLRARGVKQPIHIVENGIDLERFARVIAREQARLQFHLPPQAQILGILGKIDFRQKQQDFLLRTFARFPEFAESHLVIGGSGPDDGGLDALIERLNLSDRVKRIPWIDFPEKLYPALNALVLPSRFEGVPLVMIEALACGVPVIGSDCDGMRDFLPEPWRFPVGSAKGLIRAWQNSQETQEQYLPALRERIRTSCALAHFQESFLKTCAPD